MDMKFSASAGKGMEFVSYPRDPAKLKPSASGFNFERKKERMDMKFSALAGKGMEFVSYPRVPAKLKPSASGFNFERKKERMDMKFSALAGKGMEFVSSDFFRCLSRKIWCKLGLSTQDKEVL